MWSSIPSTFAFSRTFALSRSQAQGLLVEGVRGGGDAVLEFAEDGLVVAEALRLRLGAEGDHGGVEAADGAPARRVAGGGHLFTEAFRVVGADEAETGFVGAPEGLEQGIIQGEAVA